MNTYALCMHIHVCVHTHTHSHSENYVNKRLTLLHCAASCFEWLEVLWGQDRSFSSAASSHADDREVTAGPISAKPRLLESISSRGIRTLPEEQLFWFKEGHLSS